MGIIARHQCLRALLIVSGMLAAGCAAGTSGRSSSPLVNNKPHVQASVIYVANSDSGTVTPIAVPGDRTRHPIVVAPGPWQIVISPDGKTVYVAGYVDRGSSRSPATLTVIRTASNSTIRNVTMCQVTGAPVMAITPSGKTLYYLCPSANRVIPVRTSTLAIGRPVYAGFYPNAIAITPDGKTAYISNGDTTVTPINTVTNLPEAPIKVALGPGDIAITPDGKTAYAVATSGSVVPVNTATNIAGTPIEVGGPGHIAITPDGTTAYVTSVPNPDSYQGFVVPINIATNTRGRPIRVGLEPSRIVITPNGKKAYVTNLGSGTVTPINLMTNSAGDPIKVGRAPICLAASPDSQMVYVVDSAGFGIRGAVIPIRTATNTAGRPIRVGRFPCAIAIAR